jgi:hypothetical protein
VLLVGASFQVKRTGFQLWKHLDHSQWIYLLLKVTLTSRSTLILIPRIFILARTRLMLLGSLQKSYILIRVIIVLSRFLHIFPSIWLPVHLKMYTRFVTYAFLICYLNYLSHQGLKLIEYRPSNFIIMCKVILKWFI